MAVKKGLGKGFGSIFSENIVEEKNKTVMLKLSEIERNNDQPRQSFDEEALGNLAESIAAHGLLQPIIVRPFYDKGYEIVAGERRYRASRMAGLSEVPAIIINITDGQMMEFALIENLQRENLNPIEEAEGFNTLMEEHGFTQEEISKSVGKSRPAIANALRLLNLPEEVRQMVKEGKISAGHARALLGIADETLIPSLAKTVMEKELSVRQTEKLVKEIAAQEHNVEEKAEKKIEKLVKSFVETELALAEHLGKKVRVIPAKNREGGVLQIEFYSEKELHDLARMLNN